MEWSWYTISFCFDEQYHFNFHNQKFGYLTIIRPLQESRILSLTSSCMPVCAWRDSASMALILAAAASMALEVSCISWSIMSPSCSACTSSTLGSRSSACAMMRLMKSTTLSAWPGTLFRVPATPQHHNCTYSVLLLLSYSTYHKYMYSYYPVQENCCKITLYSSIRSKKCLSSCFKTRLKNLDFKPCHSSSNDWCHCMTIEHLLSIAGDIFLP